MRRKVISYLLSTTMLLIMIIAGTIVANAASYTADFDLTKGNVVIDNSTYSGYDSSGNLITGSHNSSNKYIVNGNNTTTANTIRLSGSNLKCDLTLNNVKRNEKDSVGLYIVKGTGENKDVVVRLQGTNTLGQLYYSGNSKLKITSAEGDGKTSGTLNVTAATAWGAAIGGPDGDEHFTGLTISGGTINAKAMNGAAIGGGGNGEVEINIEGGKVTAENGLDLYSGTLYASSATIGGGGGQSGQGGSAIVTITGGTVTAKNNSVGVAIGAGGSEKSETVGAATVNLFGGNVTANAVNSSYDISGGHSDASNEWGSTSVTIRDCTYSGTINANATVDYTALVFDLAKGNVAITNSTYTGYDSSGRKFTGVHKSTNKYIVRQSNNTTATENQILFSGNNVTADVTLDGINSSAINSIDIPADSLNVKNITFHLKGTNKVNNIRYFTSLEADGIADYEYPPSTLTFTSADGDGSTNGYLEAIPKDTGGREDQGSMFYNAVIGGTDEDASVTGLFFNGGTIKAISSVENDCTAIGGGGNGYAQITINGGSVYAENHSSGAAIGGGCGYTSIGPGCDITINGGAVTAINHGIFKTVVLNANEMVYGVAIGGGSTYNRSSYHSNVTINGGTVYAEVPEGQTAIGGGNTRKGDAGSGTVTVTGGTITCKGGIGGGSTRDGKGAAGTLNVTGGTLSATGFIGGGSTTKGSEGGSATVKISGDDTVIKACSIGGGVVENTNVANKANVEITGGDIQAQILMEGVGSTFDMSGGTIDNSKAKSEGYIFKKENGGAVYIAKGEAKMTGGIITKCSSESGLGGALYVAGGSFNLSGTGIIQECSSEQGGAAYVSGGSVSISGGTIKDCSSADGKGGAIYVTGGSFTMSGGEINDCEANEGGAVYVSGAGGVAISGGTIENCNAENGGAAYVNGGSANISGGTITNNTVERNGGGVYVSGGNVTMTDGDMVGNKATTNGGAVYITGGNFTMSGGTMSGNTALNGGASYIEGGNFTMISGELKDNVAYATSSGAAEAGTEGYGGAVYASKTDQGGGTIIIGVENCTGEGENHSVTYTSLPHPIVTNNEAEFGGGFAVNGGNVYFYCGTVQNNKTDSDGTGKNVFMKDGNIVHYLDETHIGKENADGTKDHGMVSTGGELTVHFKDNGEDKFFKVQLIYNANIDDPVDANIETIWIGEAPDGYFLNLPYCPTEWQQWQAADNRNLRFVGWTETPNRLTSDIVRSTEDYNPIGAAVEIHDTTIGDDENIMRFYAVWAPARSNISYQYVLDGAELVDYSEYNAPREYLYTITEDTIQIGTPSRAGYTFEKWILYASHETISNWGSDPDMDPYNSNPTNYEQIKNAKSINGPTLKTLQNFGDITLVAVFKPAYSELTINKAGVDGTNFALDANQKFLFRIQGRPYDNALSDVDMYVLTDGNGSAKISELPVGEYTIVEEVDWSWRYGAKKLENGEYIPASTSEEVVVDDPSEKYEVTFINSRDEIKWLSGDAYENNNYESLLQTVRNLFN